MEDLYYKKRLKHWIAKKKELDEPDRSHVFKIIEFMKEKENSHSQ